MEVLAPHGLSGIEKHLANCKRIVQPLPAWSSRDDQPWAKVPSDFVVLEPYWSASALAVCTVPSRTRFFTERQLIFACLVGALPLLAFVEGAVPRRGRSNPARFGSTFPLTFWQQTRRQV